VSLDVSIFTRLTASCSETVSSERMKERDIIKPLPNSHHVFSYGKPPRFSNPPRRGGIPRPTGYRDSPTGAVDERVRRQQSSV
jgi:hypothetical protein